MSKCIGVLKLLLCTVCFGSKFFFFFKFSLLLEAYVVFYRIYFFFLFFHWSKLWHIFPVLLCDPLHIFQMGRTWHCHNKQNPNLEEDFNNNEETLNKTITQIFLPYLSGRVPYLSPVFESIWGATHDFWLHKLGQHLPPIVAQSLSL